MSRMIFIPQLPNKLRYSEFWITELENEFKKEYDEVIVLGKNELTNISRINDGMFSTVKSAIDFELIQIKEYLSIKLLKDDTLFLADLSFPGFFPNVLYHHNPGLNRCFAYCHATSKNYMDYFGKLRYSKFPCETSHSELFNTIFVGSNYHKNKLGWKNIKVVGVSIPPYPIFKEPKENEIISVVRPNIQKITKKLESLISKNFSTIVRKNCDSWEQYYKFLSSAKLLLITTKEDTFGYSTLEAIRNNTAVIAPNNFSYPELLPSEYLYDNYDDLSMKIWSVLNDDLKCPKKILCNDLCENFYKNIITEMKGGVI